MCVFVLLCVCVCLCFFVFRGGFEQDVENGYRQHADTCHGKNMYLFSAIYKSNDDREEITATIDRY